MVNNTDNTPDWNLYEAGKKYNNRLTPNYYRTIDCNWEFYAGNQWRNLEDTNMPKPVFNILKRVVSFMVASITSNKTSIHFEPMLYEDNDELPDYPGFTLSDFANAEVDNLLDKFKMDFKIRDALTDGAVSGDYAAHFFFDMNSQPFGMQYPDIKGEIQMELVDGSNIMFGNANNPRVEVQPYIIVAGRDMVQNLKDEAAMYHDQQQEVDNIHQDRDYFYQSSYSGKIEVDADEGGKALYIIVYRKDKKTGTIKASKSVRSAYIYKDVDTGLKNYPIAWGNWEKQKNQYHGRALVTGLLPNQIFINRMFSMVMYHLMMTAFPKAVYNADLIDLWNNEIGAAIPVSGMDLSAPIKNIAGYLEPAQMSNQIIQTIDYAMQYTKETLGINDAALGDISNPQNTSAIIAMQKSSSIPLENPKSNMYEWMEDIGRILFDMMGTYYGQRPVVVDKDGQKQTILFDFSVFRDMWLRVRADVGESSYWSEIAAISTLDNLLAQQKIDFVDYLERVPDAYIPQKEELISKLKEQMQQQQQMASDPQAVISQLSPQEQQAFYSASPDKQQAILAQFQQHTQGGMING